MFIYRYTLISFFLFISISNGFTQNQTTNKAWADSVLSTMNVDERIGQLFMVAAYSNKTESANKQLITQVKTYHPGGIIFFQGDVKNQITLTNQLQEATKIPLFIGMDAEHGLGWRLKDGMTFPRMMTMGAISNDTIHFQTGAAIARHLHLMGVHINFAPVVDINNNAENPVIGMRSYGEDVSKVIRYAHQYARGSYSEKVMPVLKHFPGHGNTNTDSHLATPIVNHSKKELEKCEFAPYHELIPLGLPAVMVGHISLPKIDTSNAPASISKKIVTGILRHEMKFNGLIFTDAMNMEGVNRNMKPGEAEVAALLAGDDVLLFPKSLETAILAIKNAIKDGTISMERIDESCRKILAYKKEYGADHFNKLVYSAIQPQLQTQADIVLKRRIYKEAITLIKNDEHLLPLKKLNERKIAVVIVGASTATPLISTLKKYTNIVSFSASKFTSSNGIQLLKKELKPFNTIIVYNDLATDKPKDNYGYTPLVDSIAEFQKHRDLIYIHPNSPYGVNYYNHDAFSALLIGYDKSALSQEYCAEALFGGIGCHGKLPVSINSSFKVGYGITTHKTRLGYGIADEKGLNSAGFTRIDSICNDAIKKKATPGCQVLVAYKGDIIFEKNYGTLTYMGNDSVSDATIYDLASVTKIAATVPALMALENERRISQSMPLERFLPEYRHDDKGNITIQELLLHESGLCASIPFFSLAIDREKMNAPLFSRNYMGRNSIQVEKNLFMNSNIQYKDHSFSNRWRNNYDSIAPGIYIYPSYLDSIAYQIHNTPLDAKNYRYSDIGFLFLQEIVEKIKHQPLDAYCNKQFYRQLGMDHTLFDPLKRYDKGTIAPTCIDQIYRKCSLQGTVHDPVAAVLGGVCGNAGLFANANDLAKLMQMFLNLGVYGGEHYLSSNIILHYTSQQKSTNRRGLGFDKQNNDKPESYISRFASPYSYGHTGFTGTMVWVDPQYQLIYIFLSNRTYPDEYNKKLTTMNVRTNIQDEIYKILLEAN